MIKQCIIKIEDETNIKLEGLDLVTRKKCANAVKYFLPHARYSPAYKLGRWDGTTSFCTIGGRTYLNLLDKMIPILQEEGYEFEIEDLRQSYQFQFDKIDENSLSHINWPKGHRFEGQPIMLRDYQVTAINECIENLQGISVAPTSAGKTIITSTLSMLAQQYGRTIVIVPNKNLVQQTEEDYRNIGLDVGVLYGDRKEYDKTHTICTWQSLNVLDKKSKDALDDGQKDVFLDGLVAVICDEVHMVKNANVLHTLLTTTFANIPIRWGLTGTIPEEEYNQVSLYSAIGPLIGSLTARELQEQGHLAKCNINILQTQETAVYKDYQSELKHLVTNEERLAWLAKEIQGISKTGNTLVLIDRIETGEILHELIPDSVFISGKMKATKRKEHYKEINIENNSVMIATYGTTSTGISINRIFNLVLVEPGKSFVRVIQSIGRGLRKADDKDAVEVFDVASKCKFSNRHLIKRRKFYSEVQYPFKQIKINY
jgi:superfamily II DNA or RNA helicase